MKTTDTRINVVKAASRYSEKYREVILPEEYMAELEYLYEVFKLRPKKPLYRTANTKAQATR